MIRADLALYVLFAALVMGFVTVLVPDDIDPRIHLAALIAAVMVTVLFMSLLG